MGQLLDLLSWGDGISLKTDSALAAGGGQFRAGTWLSVSTGSWPRRRAIQHAATSRLKHRRLWNTGSPAFAGDDIRNYGEGQTRPALASSTSTRSSISESTASR